MVSRTLRIFVSRTLSGPGGRRRVHNRSRNEIRTLGEREATSERVIKGHINENSAPGGDGVGTRARTQGSTRTQGQSSFLFRFYHYLGRARKFLSSFLCFRSPTFTTTLWCNACAVVERVRFARLFLWEREIPGRDTWPPHEEYHTSSLVSSPRHHACSCCKRRHGVERAPALTQDLVSNKQEKEIFSCFCSW